MREIGEGLYPDEKRVVVTWNETHLTETPIRFQHGDLRGFILPSESVIVPENVAAILDQSSYDVTITDPQEPAAPAGDDEIEQAVADVEMQAKAQALIGQSVDKIKESLAGADLALLRAALAAEEAEGAGKTRSTAIAAIEAAIDAHPDQIAALSNADPATNEQAS